MKLCCGLSLVGTIWLEDNHRPAIGIQDVTATANMITTSPAHNEPSASMASPVGASITRDNTASVAQVYGQINRVETLQAVIEIHVIPAMPTSRCVRTIGAHFTQNM